MKTEKLKEAVTLAEKVGYVLVTTADVTGLPHVAAAAKMALLPEQRVAVEGWFCPTTALNVQEKRRIALVVWDASQDTGYQLLGEVEKVEDVAMLNGHAPGLDESSLPRVERRLLIHVDRIAPFRRRPHTDAYE